MVNEVADVSAMSAETAVTPETARLVALSRVSRLLPCREVEPSLLGEGVGHDIAPSCLRKGEPTGDSDTHTSGRFTQAMNDGKSESTLKVHAFRRIVYPTKTGYGILDTLPSLRSG